MKHFKSPELPRYMVVYILESTFDFRKKRLIEGGARVIMYNELERGRSEVLTMQDQFVVSEMHIVRPYWVTHAESYKMYPTQLERLASYKYTATAGIPIYNTNNNLNTSQKGTVYKTFEGYLATGEYHNSLYDTKFNRDIQRYSIEVRLTKDSQQ